MVNEHEVAMRAPTASRPAGLAGGPGPAPGGGPGGLGVLLSDFSIRVCCSPTAIGRYRTSLSPSR